MTQNELTADLNAVLHSGIIAIFGWLLSNTDYYNENADKLPTLSQWREHVTFNTENQHYMLVQVVSADQVVAVLFAQCDGTNVTINLMGVEMFREYHGIGSLLLGWYLSGLPNPAIDGNVTFTTLTRNREMRAWCQRFGSQETPKPERNMVEITFPIEAACARLASCTPSQANYRFEEVVGQYRFNVLYAGLRPEFVTNESQVVMRPALGV